MVWRGWTFFCGIPLGSLCAVAIEPRTGSVALGLGALAGGVFLVLLATDILGLTDVFTFIKK